MTKKKFEKSILYFLTTFFLLLLLTSLFSCSEKEPVYLELIENDESFDAYSDEQITAPVCETSDEDISRTKYTHGEIRLKVLCAGDNIGHEKVIANAERYADGTDFQYNFMPMYADFVKQISDADIAYVNQESPMCGDDYEYSYYPYYNVPQELGDTLIDVGFNVIDIVNEHMLDMKEAGLRSYIDYWNSKNVVLLGASNSDEVYDDIKVVEYDGIKVAFLSYTYGTKIRLDEGSSMVIPYIDEDDLTRQVKIAKQKADFVFVSVHWGEENNFDVTWYEERIASLLTELGVDVVVGTHPHVIQPVVWKENSEGHRTLVIYSLGNYLNTMYYWFDMLGGIVTFDIVWDNYHDDVYVDNIEFVPTFCHYDSKRSNLKLYYLENYTEALCKAHGAQPWSNFTLEKLYDRVVDTISEEFLSDFFVKYSSERSLTDSSVISETTENTSS